MGLGFLHYRQGKVNLAIEQYLKAKDITEKSGNMVPGAYLHLGQCYIDLKRYKEAIDLYQLYLASDKRNLHIQSDLAKAYEYNGNDESALKIYKKLSKMNDDYWRKIGNDGIQRLSKDVSEIINNSK